MSMMFSVKLLNDPTNVIQIQGPMEFSIALDFDVVDEKAYGNIKSFEIVNKGLDALEYNAIGMTSVGLVDFLTSVQYLLNFMKRYLNKIALVDGILLPLPMMDLKSNFYYVGDAMIVAFDIDLDDDFEVMKFLEQAGLSGLIDPNKSLLATLLELIPLPNL